MLIKQEAVGKHCIDHVLITLKFLLFIRIRRLSLEIHNMRAQHGVFKQDINPACIIYLSLYNCLISNIQLDIINE